MGHSMSTSMSITFGDLLKRYRIRAGFTISELSEKVGTSRKRVSAWETGKSVPRDRARLEDLAAILKLSSREEDTFYATARRFKESGLVDNYYYERGEVASEGTNNYQLASQLDEWKVVHTNAQELYFSVLLIEPQLSIRLPKDENIKILIESWTSGCESIALLTKQRFVKFDWISNKIIDDYCLFMTSDDNVLSCMMRMKPDDIVTLHHTRNAIISLKGLLTELLRIADFYISDIAKKIKEKN